MSLNIPLPQILLWWSNLSCSCEENCKKQW